MNHVPVPLLLDGMLRTLREVVLPAVDGRYARGHLFAVLDVLNNLRDRVELRAELLASECASAETALRAVIDALDAGDAAALRDAVAAAPPSPPEERAAALRAVLVSAIGVVAALPDDAVPAARTALATHLREQAMRDVSVLKPSLLEEISKG